MESRSKRFMEEARRKSDMAFAAGLREYDHNHVLWKFNDAANILINIQEDQRSPEDNFRIMRGYQHAIEYIAKYCDVLISTQRAQARTGQQANRESERVIIEALKKLDNVTTLAANYLERGQKGEINVDVHFYLSANRGLLAYYKKLVEWRTSNGMPQYISNELHENVSNALSFIKDTSDDLIRDHIAPKLSAHDVGLLRDLTHCYHSIAKIYQLIWSHQECLAYVMKVIETTNTIPSAYKTEEDLSNYIHIMVTLSEVVDARNSLLNSMVDLGYGFFGGSPPRSTTENFEKVYQDCIDTNSLAAQQLLLLLMRAIYDNYQVVKYPSNLQAALQQPSYHTEFSKKMEALASRVAENKYGKGERLFSAAGVIAKASDETIQPAMLQHSRNR